MDEFEERQRKMRANESISNAIMCFALGFMLGFLVCHKLYTTDMPSQNKLTPSLTHEE